MIFLLRLELCISDGLWNKMEFSKQSLQKEDSKQQDKAGMTAFCSNRDQE